MVFMSKDMDLEDFLNTNSERTAHLTTTKYRAPIDNGKEVQFRVEMIARKIEEKRYEFIVQEIRKD